jgi:hypothetical protein
MDDIGAAVTDIFYLPFGLELSDFIRGMCFTAHATDHCFILRCGLWIWTGSDVTCDLCAIVL